jgi:site-specific DNA-cytosine methylase
MLALQPATRLFPEIVHYHPDIEDYLSGGQITGIEFFCGAGGLSFAFQLANGKLLLCVNHSQDAIASHKLNFQETEHWKAAVELIDMSLLCDADVLFGSPECTHQTNARGKQLKGQRQPGLWTDRHEMSPAEQSRASMWQMFQAAKVKAEQEKKQEGRRFKVIFIENVIEAATLWGDYEDWVQSIKALGYDYQAVFLDAAFFGVPQHRNRFFGVFWLKELPPPKLDFRPRAYCIHCDKVVSAIQRWKPGKHKGEYGAQYDYCCPNLTCTREVVPFFRPAASFLNFADRGIPIKERSKHKLKPLCPNTIQRIQSGIEEFFARPQIIPPQAYDIPPSLPKASALPFWVKYNRNGKAYSIFTPICTVSSKDRCALVFPPEGWTWAHGLPRLEDCGYRMLTEEEVQAAMCLQNLQLAEGVNIVQLCGLAVPPPLALVPLLECVRILRGEPPSPSSHAA